MECRSTVDYPASHLPRDRITCMAIHPDPAWDLVVMGDARGMLVAWHPLTWQPVPTELETCSTTQLVPDNSITQLLIDPRSSEWVYTSHAFDSTVRATSLEHQTSSVVFHARDLECSQHYGPTGPLDFALLDTGTISCGPGPASDPRVLWIASRGGGVTCIDVRDKMACGAPRQFHMASKQINALSFNQSHPDMFVTGSADQFLYLWDARMLRATPERENGSLEMMQSHSVAYYDMKNPISTLGFSPQGKSLAVLDEFESSIHVFEMDFDLLADPEYDPFSNVTTYDHSISEEPLGRHARKNQANVHLANPPRLSWNASPDFPAHFAIGNSKRCVDVRGPSGALLSNVGDDEIFEWIPTKTALHPGRMGVLATASNHDTCTYWTSEPQWD